MNVQVAEDHGAERQVTQRTPLLAKADNAGDVAWSRRSVPCTHEVGADVGVDEKPNTFSRIAGADFGDALSDVHPGQDKDAAALVAVSSVASCHGGVAFQADMLYRPVQEGFV